MSREIHLEVAEAHQKTATPESNGIEERICTGIEVDSKASEVWTCSGDFVDKLNDTGGAVR